MQKKLQKLSTIALQDLSRRALAELVRRRKSIQREIGQLDALLGFADARMLFEPGVTYLGPNGERWSGRGLPPPWLQKLMRREENSTVH